MNIERKVCAPRNFRSGRPAHLHVEAVVIHLIDGSLQAADTTFADNALADPRSAHYAIGRGGEVHQYVDEADTAFHAGKIVGPSWTGLKRAPDGTFVNPNYYTIGIEHEGRPNDEWTDAMYAASAELLRGLTARHPALAPLTRRNLVLHREIRATKSCPGHALDVGRLVVMTADSQPDAPRQLQARSTVNVRSGSPSRTAPVVRVIPAGEPVNVVREVTGESVNGISRWWQNVDGDYMWAGALEEARD